MSAKIGRPRSERRLKADAIGARTIALATQATQNAALANYRDVRAHLDLIEQAGAINIEIAKADAATNDAIRAAQAVGIQV